MYSVLFWIATCLTLDIDYFIDKEIRIFFSTANHVFFGLNDKQLTARSKYYDLRGFSTVAKIIPDSSYYRIRFKTDPICAIADDVKTCEMGTSWTINQKVFGYTIGDGSRCITLVERSVLKMMPCTESNDQIVDFKLKSEDQDCGQDGEFKGKENDDKHKDPRREILVIHVDNKNPTHDHHHQLKRAHDHVIDSHPVVPVKKKKLFYAVPKSNASEHVVAPKDKEFLEDENDGFLRYAQQQVFENQ